MASWNDARRRLFIDLLEQDGSIEVLSEGDDDVLLSNAIVNVRPGVDHHTAQTEIGVFDPQLLDNEPIACHADNDDADPFVRRFLIGRQAQGSALNAVQDFEELLTPSYVCLAQQRLQPASDPEQSWPVRPPSADSKLGDGVRIAVVDTGVVDQPGAVDVWGRHGVSASWTGLEENIYDPRTYAPDQKLAWAAGHGTFVASLIRQVAPAATIIPIKACDPMGFESELEVARGIERAVAQGAHIISVSWCCYPLDGKTPGRFEPIRLKAAVRRATKAGVLVVAAAGNSASPDQMYPAAWKDVVGVAAVDHRDRRWEHSNYGDWVDASAPGVDLRGRYIRGAENPANDPDGHAEVWDAERNYATWSGTSFSTPLVAGQIAVIQTAFNLRDATTAWEKLRDMSAPAPDDGCGRRVMVDLSHQH